MATGVCGTPAWRRGGVAWPRARGVAARLLAAMAIATTGGPAARAAGAIPHGAGIPAAPTVRALAAADTASGRAAAPDSAARGITRIEHWLRLGPVARPRPAWADTGRFRERDADVLDETYLARDGTPPVEGARVAVPGVGGVTWQAVTAGRDGVRLAADGPSPRVAWLVAWVEAPRWVRATLRANADGPIGVWVDGRRVVHRVDAQGGEASGEVALRRGVHRVVVRAAWIAPDSASARDAWRVDVRLEAKTPANVRLVARTSPRRPLDLHDVLDAPSASRIAVSADGALAAVAIVSRRPPKGERTERLEIRRVADGRLVETLADTKGSQWTWAPGGHRLGYVVRDGERAGVRVLDVDAHTVSTVLRDAGDFGGFAWSRDGSFIVWTARREPKEKPKLVQRVRSLADRRRGERTRSELYVTAVDGGMTRRVAAGPFAVHALDTHPDGAHVLVLRSWEDVTQRGYSVEELAEIDVRDGSVRVLHTSPWLDGAFYAPDGRRVVVSGGPSAFGAIGRAVADSVTPNEYDTQLYLLDRDDLDVTPLTRGFDPAVRRAWWPRRSKDLLLIAEDRDRVRLFACDVARARFRAIGVDCDVVGRGAAAADAPVVVLTGSSAARPWRVFAVDARRARSRELLDPAADRFAAVRLGRVEDFDVTLEDGTTIVGRVHLPPDFDPSRRYPAIVYYYGGTSPVSRSFGGRYPKNLWAAHGYVVYVPQPSGATGFGQAFSARHVNDWGERTSREIIECTKRFLEAHPYVDPHRVGCIGASFGGFLTEYLVTRTDIFAAAVSHAGISGIASYWGEGYWGYGYNAVSAAGSFPWNRRDLYVERSPLFRADRVHTPILLLHGTSDHNVPPGESEQFYAALRLLGRPVEYVRVIGEDHWVLDYEKRIRWSDTIVAWFDRWLRDEPEWWESMYPPLDPAGVPRR